MGTHPIFESDFDCLTERIQIKGKCRSRKLFIPRHRSISQPSCQIYSNNSPRPPLKHNPQIFCNGRRRIFRAWPMGRRSRLSVGWSRLLEMGSRSEISRSSFINTKTLAIKQSPNPLSNQNGPTLDYQKIS